MRCSAPVFSMNCVKCGRWSYFKLQDETCDACHEENARKAATMARLKKLYGNGKAFSFNWAVIQCITREGLTRKETAEVLGVDEETIDFEMDIAYQNAY